MLPTFLIIGAQKAGTTSLCELLGEHPQVYICPLKEPHFFSVDLNFKNGMDWYKAHFRGVSGERAVGEGSTSYTMQLRYPMTAKRIATSLPHVRFVYIIRHPLHRIESAYMHLLITRREVDSLQRVLERHPFIIDTSQYWKQLQEYRRFFADNQILILFFEDFIQNPNKTLLRCFEFLNVDTSFRVKDPRRPRNPSVGRQIDTHVGHALRLLRVNRLGQYLPESAKKVLRSMLQRQIKDRPRWSPEQKQAVWDQLAEDTRQILRHCNRPEDFWTLDD